MSDRPPQRPARLAIAITYLRAYPNHTIGPQALSLYSYVEPPEVPALASPSSTAQAAIWLLDLNPSLSMMCFT